MLYNEGELNDNNKHHNSSNFCLEEVILWQVLETPLKD